MIKRLFFLILVISVQITLSAQQRTHMPYSIYGLGDIKPEGVARNMGMGRTGIALASPNYLNTLNPASYHAIDSISFFFDFGMSSDFVKYRTQRNETQRGNDFNINNLDIAFRITKNWSAGIGIAPFSSIGYKVQTTDNIEGSPNETFNAEITGKGGLNNFYLNNSYTLFDHISLGVNFSYLFGSIQKAEEIAADGLVSGIVINRASYLKRVYADFGIQGFFPVNKDLRITLGAVFGNRHYINSNDRITISEGISSVLSEETTGSTRFELPLYFGGGLSVVYKNSLTITADYLYHDWSGTPSKDKNYKYRSNNIYRLGAELIPGRYSQLGYFGGIAYRAGLYYEEFYLELKNRIITDYGITAGIGLPFLQNRTSFNLSYNYGIKGTLENNLIKENYHSVILNLTLHDWWFLKRKID